MTATYSALTHSGVSLYMGRWFDTTCYIHVIDLNSVKMSVAPGFMAVHERAMSKNAQLAFNANGWQKVSPYQSNEYLVADGVVIKSTTLDGRGGMEVSKNGIISFSDRPSFQTSWNYIGFDRRIATNGVYNSKIIDVSVAPRTVYGVDATGCLIVLVCDGRREGEKGLTFKECWSVMQEFSCITCGNADGGYSSCAYNDQFGVLNEETYKVEYRRTVCQVLFYAGILGDIESPTEPEIPTEEPNMSNQKAIVVKSARFRSLPTTLTKDIGAESSVGFTFFPQDQKTDPNNPSIQMAQVPSNSTSPGAGMWLPLSIGSTVYTKLEQVVVNDPDEPNIPVGDIVRVVIELDNGTTLEAPLSAFKEVQK